MDVKTVAEIVRFGRFSRPFVNYMHIHPMKDLEGN